MTKQQAKVLAFIRTRGEVTWGDLTTYQARSIDPLVRDGWLKYISCNGCQSCKCFKGEPWHCEKLRILVVK